MESKNQVILDGNQGSEDTVHASHPVQHNSDDTAEHLAYSIKKKLSMLAQDRLIYGTVFIHRVPEKHRSRNQEAYTPRLVSIGFLHHGESQLQAMEEYKLKYLNNFLHTFRVSVEKLTEYVHSQKKLVCGCYEDIYTRNLSNLSKKKLSEVILLDGIFIVMLFLKNRFPEMREMGDIIFSSPWVSHDILHDLLLFENQLPMRFLCALYDTCVAGYVSKCLDDDTIYPQSFIELAHQYFMNVGNTGKQALTRDFGYPRHLVEFLSILHMSDQDETRRYERDLLKVAKKSEFATCATATELLAAGVKFQHGTGKTLFDVHFDKKTGELKIPQLTVNDHTETFFRNLIAFEQSGYHSKHITSYVILLDNLIDTHRDVDVLVKYKIIVNELGSGEQVAELFNNLYKEFVTDPKEFYFFETCRDLNDYSRDLWHKWNSRIFKWYAMLRRDYIGSPWSVLSVIAAFILLVLTAIQTVCSLLQVHFGT